MLLDEFISTVAHEKEQELKELEDQQAARRAKNAVRKEKRVARKNAQMGIEEPTPAAAATPEPAATTKPAKAGKTKK